MIRALVWDFDGLIVDSEMADCTAWRDEFERAAVAISMATYAGYWADWSQHRRTRMIDRLVAAAPHVDRTVVEARRLARYRELCADLPPRPGIEAWLRRAAELGLRQIVATNDDTGRSRQHLDRLGLAALLEQVVTAHGIARKPAPDLYLAALAQLAVDAAAAVAIEDSPHGIAAAKAAGLRVVAVPTEVSRHCDLGAADLIVDDPAGVSVDEVLADLAGG